MIREYNICALYYFIHVHILLSIYVIFVCLGREAMRVGLSFSSKWKWFFQYLAQMWPNFFNFKRWNYASNTQYTCMKASIEYTCINNSDIKLTRENFLNTSIRVWNLYIFYVNACIYTEIPILARPLLPRTSN